MPVVTAPAKAPVVVPAPTLAPTRPVNTPNAPADYINGTALGEKLTGSARNDEISGGGGDDVLLGMAGRNKLVGGTGSDTADYSWATSPVTVDLRDTNYQSTTATSTDALIGIENVRGGALNDRLTGNGLNNNLDGGAGDDVLDGGGGSDVLIGGAGIDTLLGGDGSDILYAEQNDALLDGGSGFDTVVIDGDFDDTSNGQLVNVEEVRLDDGGHRLVLDNQTENIRLRGGAGDDYAAGGLGSDSFDMGLGDDTIVADDQDALIFGGRGTDTLELGTSVSGRTTFSGLADDRLLGVEIVNLRQGGMVVSLAQQTEDMTVNGFADGASNITGGAGTETINGGTGADTIDAGAGDDVINPGVGDDLIKGGTGNDTVNFGAALDGNDTVDGGAGSGDTLNFTDNGTGTDDLDHVTGFEYLNVGDAPTDIITVDGLVASGATLHVDASGLSSSSHFNWDGSAETDGRFDIESGAGADSITGGVADDTIRSGAGDDTIVGGRGADVLDGGAGRDDFIFSDGDQDFGRSTGIDTIQNFDPAADTIVFADWVDRDANPARLMFEAATLGANESVASGTELLMVTNSSISGSGDIAQNIATALGSAFDVTSIAANMPSRIAGTVADGDGAQTLRFAVQGAGNAWWIGEYRDSGFDDVVSKSDIKILGTVETGTGQNFTPDQVLNFFEQPTQEAPQGLTLTLPADTGHSDTGPIYTTNQTVTVAGLLAGNRLAYTLDGTTWTTLAPGSASFTLAAGQYDAGDIQIRQVDAFGNYSAPGKTDASDVAVVVDRSADTIGLVAEPDALDTDTVVVEWTNTRAGDAPIVSNTVYYRENGGVWQSKSVAVGETSATLGTMDAGAVDWYVQTEDAAGNIGTSATDSFAVRSIYWDEDAPGISQGIMPFVSLGIYEQSTYNGLPYYIGVGGVMPGWDIATSGLMFEFQPKDQIDAEIWDDFVIFDGPVNVNWLKVHDLDNKLGDYSGGLRDLGSTWYDTGHGTGVLVINMDDVSHDEGSTAPETRLQIDMDIALAGGGTEHFFLDVYIDWASGIA